MPPLIYITLISHILFIKHMIYTTYNTISCNIPHILIHQNAQWMHDLNPCPSSPRYSYTYALIPRRDALNPGVPLITHQPVKFLWILGDPIPHCCVLFIEIYIFTKNWAESLLFGELYLIYNLYNSITITHLGSQQK